MNSQNVKRVSLFYFLILSLLLQSGCKRAHDTPTSTVDAVLIGGGIMSATLASLLLELDHDMKVDVYERLPQVALESSAAWNNAGTGHAAFCEPNYTPMSSDGSISIKKAVEVGEAFEVSKQYWAHLANVGVLKPKEFIFSVPHLSFVFGDENVNFLKKRYDAMIKHPLFYGMEYSEDHQNISAWAPLLIKGRNANEKIAATRMMGGVDVDFGALTEGLFAGVKNAKHFNLRVKHEVQDLVQNSDKTWTVVVKDLTSNQTKSIRTKFVFVGAGGGALTLLQKSGIKEAEGFGGFPVGGAWLVSEREDLIAQHEAKVYGKAAVGSPPMSVPHLDTRYIAGKKALLFGPFATFSTKFLKSGSWSDLLMSISLSNFVPMMQVGVQNLDLVRYLIAQVMLSKEEQIASLKEYLPSARVEDWRYELAGQRVQVIKKDDERGGTLQFGTELVTSADKSLVALLGASPGASTAVQTMLDVLETSFADRLAESTWQEKLRTMIPSYGKKLGDDENLIVEVRERNRRVLALEY